MPPARGKEASGDRFDGYARSIHGTYAPCEVEPKHGATDVTGSIWLAANHDCGNRRPMLPVSVSKNRHSFVSDTHNSTESNVYQNETETLPEPKKNYQILNKTLPEDYEILSSYSGRISF